MIHPEVITLTDSSSGAEAKILAGYGFNCFQFRVEHVGQPLDILWSEPDFERGDKRASTNERRAAASPCCFLIRDGFVGRP